MAYRIQVPLNSPALRSYLNDGWRQSRVEGQWAVLQMDELEVFDHTDRYDERPSAPIQSDIIEW